MQALGAHQGRDYNLEKQKKQQKQAAKRKGSKARLSSLEEKENVQAQSNGTGSVPEAESERWESDESDAAKDMAVYWIPTATISQKLTQCTDQYISSSQQRKRQRQQPRLSRSCRV